MDNARPTKKAKRPANFSPDDIPFAKRDTPVRSAASARQPLLLGGVVAFVALLGMGFAAWLPTKTSSSTPSTASTQSADKNSATANLAANSTESPTDSETPDLLGHYPYPEASQADLKPITADGRFQLRAAAAQKYLAMVDAARRSGVILVTISGYRSIAEQEQLFFDIGAQRGQQPTKRAAVSAPPGYSEHHTGYAVDVGDGRLPATNLNPAFEKTAAFQWLQNNAARFGFELSFPKNNEQGISYEPWHWRFVGDRESLETFYKTKKPAPAQTSANPAEASSQ